MRLTAWLLSFLLVVPVCAIADTPVIYTKTVIKIIPAPEPVKAPVKKEEEKRKENDMGKAEDSKVSDLLPSLHRVTKEFTVEVRPLSFLDQRDFIAHQPFSDKEGMMLMVDPHDHAQLKSSNLLGKIDVLFVLEDGIIEKIAPEIALPELNEPLSSEKPLRAFIFLKSGMAQMSDIRPGDSVENAMFKPHPVILQ